MSSTLCEAQAFKAVSITALTAPLLTYRDSRWQQQHGGLTMAIPDDVLCLHHAMNVARTLEAELGTFLSCAIPKADVATIILAAQLDWVMCGMSLRWKRHLRGVRHCS